MRTRNSRKALFLTLLTAFLGLASSSCSKNSASAREQQVEEQQPKVQSAPAEKLLGEGQTAPLFEAKSHEGTLLKLADLQGQFVILYFYPKDGTPGCTAEAQGFAKNSSQITQAGAVVIGVSSDDAASHQDFAEEYGLPFYLLADTERSIAKAYGVGSFLGMTSRVTFLTGPAGKIQKVYPDVAPKEHAQQLLNDIKALKM